MENTKGVTPYSLLVSEQLSLERNPDFLLPCISCQLCYTRALLRRKKHQATRLTFFKQQPVITAPNSQLQENSGKGSQGLHLRLDLNQVWRDEEKTCTTLMLGNILWGGRLEGTLTSPSSFESSCPQERKSSYLAKGMTGSGSSRR